jgi:hypothetical protein
VIDHHYQCVKLTVLGPMPDILAHLQPGRTSIGEPYPTPAVKGSIFGGVLPTEDGDSEGPAESISRIYHC